MELRLTDYDAKIAHMAALRDYCTIIQEEYEKANLHTPEALLALRDRLQNKKRYGG